MLRKVNWYYKYDDDVLPEFDEVKTRIEASNEALVKDAECVNDEGVVRETEIVKDDVRRVRTRSCSRGDTNAKEDGDFPFRCSLLTSSVKRDAELDRDYLESAAKALGTDEKKLYATALSRREETPLNEYDNGDKTIAKSAPDVFIFGSAYEIRARLSISTRENISSCNIQQMQHATGHYSFNYLSRIGDIV